VDEEWGQLCGVDPDLRVGDAPVPPPTKGTIGQVGWNGSQGGQKRSQVASLLFHPVEPPNLLQSRGEEHGLDVAYGWPQGPLPYQWSALVCSGGGHHAGFLGAMTWCGGLPGPR